MTGDRLIDDDPALGSFEFVVSSGPSSSVIATPGSAPVPIPPELDPARALIAPLLARALAVWSDLRLELGQAAVVSGEGRFGALLALVAQWRGALPSMLLRENAGPAGVKHVALRTEDPEGSLSELKAAIAGCRTAAFVDVSGRAIVLDLLFEALPRYGRLMLAGRAGERATVDYYNHWHRKGTIVLARLVDPVADLAPRSAGTDPVHLARAFRLLADDARAAACFACWDEARDAVSVQSASPAG